MRLTAITGGIGAGKSMVSHILAVMGYTVYDCDSEAKRLMSESEDIRMSIAQDISQDVITADGKIDRRLLAGIVFGDKEKLNILNRIVHGEVRDDLRRWRDSLTVMGYERAFVETAILRESGLDCLVDDVWVVDADIETRVSRVMARNNMRRPEVERRIASQCAYMSEDASYIINDDRAALLPQIERLLAQ